MFQSRKYNSKFKQNMESKSCSTAPPQVKAINITQEYI